MPADPYAGLACYVGDIHNHCGISYGHGSIEDAYRNARLQLDFASVTGHAWWHDMPVDDPRLAEEVAYHREGFRRLAECWEHVQDVTAAVHEDGQFVSLLSYEWHSMTYGDHCVYYRDSHGPLLRPDSLEELRAGLRREIAQGRPAMALPHHIGYHKGWRGINWDTYTEELSPLAEIVSMHGCGESDRAPRNYLHTMGPRDAGSMAYHGLGAGHVFGFIGSTDHHSAHPGSHGYGRVAVWASELTRQGIWDALVHRRTYALTGDRIELRSWVNDTPMGSIAPAAAHRDIRAHIVAGDAVAQTEVVRNGEVIWSGGGRPAGAAGAFCGLLGLSVGWGKAGVITPWDIELGIEGGELLGIEPRLRGVDTVDPLSPTGDSYSFSDWERTSATSVRLRTRTRSNPTVLTDATQQLVLRVRGDDRTVLTASLNGHEVRHSVGELRAGPLSGYLSGFVSPAYQFHRAVDDAERTVEIATEDTRTGAGRDWYHVRVRQANDQWAIGSPIWVASS